MTGLKTLVAAEWAWSCLAVRLLRLLSLGQTTLMRQTMPMRKWAALVPHSEPGAIAPTTTQRTASSAMTVVAIHHGECESQGEPERQGEGLHPRPLRVLLTPVSRTPTC